MIFFHLHRRAAVATTALLCGLILVLCLVGIVVRWAGGSSTPRSAKRHSALILPTPDRPVPSDVASWDARPAVRPATSAAYPPIPRRASADPAAYVTAFVTELFSRDYNRQRRSQLIAWAQSEDAPLRSTNYPTADWSKVLVDSLTDLTWDAATETPIPADGPWLALQAERGCDVVSGLHVSLDPQWEQRLATGYAAPDPLATVRDVSLTVTETTSTGGHQDSRRFDVALAVQLGSSPGGGYGVAATNNYVIKEVA